MVSKTLRNARAAWDKLAWRFDRFARSVSHLLRALETFKALGIEFVSLSEQVDTSTPTGKMVFTVLGAVAELERLYDGCVPGSLKNTPDRGFKSLYPGTAGAPVEPARLRLIMHPQSARGDRLDRSGERNGGQDERSLRPRPGGPGAAPPAQ